VKTRKKKASGKLNRNADVLREGSSNQDSFRSHMRSVSTEVAMIAHQMLCEERVGRSKR
jgi:hypothetical protein